MVVEYSIVLTILNLTDNSTATFNKTFSKEITAADNLLYNNHHVLSSGQSISTMFNDDIENYCAELDIEQQSIEIDEFEITSLTDRVDVYFENLDDYSVSLSPVIKAYVYPSNDALKVPKLVGRAIDGDAHTIIWEWPEDQEYAHYLTEEPDTDSEEDGPRIIATIPLGVNSYTETNLEPDTPYTRRLINYTSEQTSAPSRSVTVRTHTVTPEISLSEYNVARNYDFTSDESERESIEEQLKAFQSGVGDLNDLKVYKQMDADFYQKFRAYFELSGKRTQRERRYDQVGFNYKACLEALEEVDEQEGDVTFRVEAYPREWIKIRDYIWVTRPIDVYVRIKCDVFLNKHDEEEEVEECTTYRPILEKEESWTTPYDDPDFLDAGSIFILFVLDKTVSLHGDLVKSFITDGSRNGVELIQKSVIQVVDAVENWYSQDTTGDLRTKIPVYYSALLFGTYKGTTAGDTGISYITSGAKADGKEGGWLLHDDPDDASYSEASYTNGNCRIDGKPYKGRKGGRFIYLLTNEQGENINPFPKGIDGTTGNNKVDDKTVLATCWSKGLYEAQQRIYKTKGGSIKKKDGSAYFKTADDKEKARFIVYFFSDGFPNQVKDNAQWIKSPYGSGGFYGSNANKDVGYNIPYGTIELDRHVYKQVLDSNYKASIGGNNSFLLTGVYHEVDGNLIDWWTNSELYNGSGAGKTMPVPDSKKNDFVAVSTNTPQSVKSNWVLRVGDYGKPNTKVYGTFRWGKYNSNPPVDEITAGYYFIGPDDYSHPEMWLDWQLFGGMSLPIHNTNGGSSESANPYGPQFFNDGRQQGMMNHFGQGAVKWRNHGERDTPSGKAKTNMIDWWRNDYYKNDGDSAFHFIFGYENPDGGLQNEYGAFNRYNTYTFFKYAMMWYGHPNLDTAPSFYKGFAKKEGNETEFRNVKVYNNLIRADIAYYGHTLKKEVGEKGLIASFVLDYPYDSRNPYMAEIKSNSPEANNSSYPSSVVILEPTTGVPYIVRREITGENFIADYAKYLIAKPYGAAIDGTVHPDSYTGTWPAYTWSNTNLAGVFREVLEGLIDTLLTKGEHHDPVYQGDIIRLKDWKQQDEPTTVNRYSIDKTVIVHVDYLCPNPFRFDNIHTPVTFSDKEQRAIIEPNNVMGQTPVEERSLYEIILSEVQQTPEWSEGYRPSGTGIDSNNNPILVVKGLSIQDSYGYADDEFIPNLNNMQWEDGWNGSINTYTDVDKMGTSSYGDDCYTVKQKTFADGGNPIYIQGYTDAIIYDDTQYSEAELNGYDNPTATLMRANASYYGAQLTNRKNPMATYGVGSNDQVSHIISLIEKGEDIYITGPSDVIDRFNSDERFIQFIDLQDDIIAHMDNIMYESPILHYRFNLEDPDARTPLYEILPTCRRFTNTLHVVLLYVYYAKNVYITNSEHYISEYGTSPLANISSPYMTLEEDFTKWTKKLWQDPVGGKDNGWYIDQYLWFMAKPMRKDRLYYDELPGPGMETFYGLVNGRYRQDNQDGKHDLKVQIPGFNIPTTVKRESIRMYIVITEFKPEDALVSYEWAHPYQGNTAITQENHDYCTFHSDSITYKDIPYMDVIATINKNDYIDEYGVRQRLELFDNKTKEILFELQKPETINTYDNYYLAVRTDNSDVLAMKYPTEVKFEDGTANIGVSFKGVVNATSKWSPRIHNGYYYLNQHEYYAYSEFDVEADFEQHEMQEFKQVDGYVSFDITCRHTQQPTESYNITKDTRSELIQDEGTFEWIDNKGMTIKPVIDGIYYKKYQTATYYSPLIMFPNKLTSAGRLKVNISFSDGSEYITMFIRSYDVEQGEWSEWAAFVNDSVPNVPLSSAYQVKFDMQPTVEYEDTVYEEYLCCYLDWKDECNPDDNTNLVMITDHLSTGVDNAEGIYISNIIDFGCETQLELDIFDSKYDKEAQIYIACDAENQEKLYLENIYWNNITKLEAPFTGRYFRYKIVVPKDEHVYWLHKKITTKKISSLTLPYVSSVQMSGEYRPSVIRTSFINTEVFTIPTDGEYHVVFNKVRDIIAADVLAKGYQLREIESIKIKCTTPSIELQYDRSIEDSFPGETLLNIPVKARTTATEIDDNATTTPFIYVKKDYYDNDIIEIIGTPQQYSPITVEDIYGNPYMQLFDKADINLDEVGLNNEQCAFMILREEYILNEDTKYIELKRHDYEEGTLQVSLNGTIVSSDIYRTLNHLIIFNDMISAGTTVHIEYRIARTFIATIDRENNLTTIYLYSDKDTYNEPYDAQHKKKYKVFFETGLKNNKFLARNLSLNPIYRTDYKGFIYLTDKHNDIYDIKIYCNPTTLKAGGYDKVDIVIEVTDNIGNPVINKPVAVDCTYGILLFDEKETDVNGVVHLVYESSIGKSTDTVIVKVQDDFGNTFSKYIAITNE